MMSLVGAAVLCTVCYYVLAELGFRQAKLFLCFCTVVLASALIDSVREKALPLFNMINSTATADVGKTVFKIIGIGYACGICRDVADNLGAGSVSSVIDLVSKLEVLSVISPYVVELIESAGELLK